MARTPIFINDERTFTTNDIENLYNTFVVIPVYYEQDEDGTIHLDQEKMMEEFQRHVTGIEIVTSWENDDDTIEKIFFDK